MRRPARRGSSTSAGPPRGRTEAAHDVHRQHPLDALGREGVDPAGSGDEPALTAAPRIMGSAGPAIRELLAEIRTAIDAIDIVELNEAFASQALACLRVSASTATTIRA